VLFNQLFRSIGKQSQAYWQATLPGGKFTKSACAAKMQNNEKIVEQSVLR
jgi:hypothetical protein